MIGQKDLLAINKELLLHLRDHMAKDQVVKNHMDKDNGSKKHAPEKRRKESKLKQLIHRKSSQLHASCEYDLMNVLSKLW